MDVPLRRAQRWLGRLRGQPPRSPSQVGQRRERGRDRGTPPDVVGRGPLLSAPGFSLGLVAIIRNEARYLEEWLAYHHALGVEHVLLYDNGSSDGLHEVLERWVNHGLVTLVHWPLPGGQLDAYSHALRMYGPSFRWLAFFDVDEFLVPLVDEDIPALLARFPDAADVRVPRIDFGFSGHRTPPDALTIEAYTGVADVFGRDPSKPPRVKTVLRPVSVSAMGIHTATVADVPIDGEGRAVPSRTVGKACHPYVQLNHYYTRSFEEFEAKRVRGSATGRIDRPAIPFELPTLAEDRSAHRFVERTRATIERLRSLDPSPYHYGSQLRLAQFPHFNDLGLFAEFAIANRVAEEPAPRREPRIRLPNLHAGTGFLGDISDTDHAPVRGELSASVHLAPLLERSRGRLECSWVTEPDVPSLLRRGSVEATPDGWKVTPEEGDLEVVFPLESQGRRRCYALGFVLDAPGPTRIELTLEHEADGGPAAEASRTHDRFELPAARTYAGVVEVAPLPLVAVAAGIRLRPSGGSVTIRDLFVISYG